MYVFTNYQPTVISLGTSFTTKTFYFRDTREQEVLLLWFWWWLQSNEAEDPTHHLSQPKWALCYYQSRYYFWTKHHSILLHVCYMCTKHTWYISHFSLQSYILIYFYWLLWHHSQAEVHLRLESSNYNVKSVCSYKKNSNYCQLLIWHFRNCLKASWNND